MVGGEATRGQGVLGVSSWQKKAHGPLVGGDVRVLCVSRGLVLDLVLNAENTKWLLPGTLNSMTLEYVFHSSLQCCF